MTTRREFFKKAGVISTFALTKKWAAAASSSDAHGMVLPLRRLTRDGQQVTAFSLGGWHVGMAENAEDAQSLLERAMELGVRFFDNSRIYQKGLAEDYMGRFLSPKYRDQIFLMTKSPARDARLARGHLEASLRALRTDYVDLWQIHSIRTPEDVDARIEAGVLDVFLEAKAKGQARYIGFTGHENPATHLHFLKRLDEMGIALDTCQMPLNVCDASFESFQTEVLPVLLEKEYGVIAMKTMAGGSMMGKRIDTTPKHIQTKDIPDVVGLTDLSLANLHQYVYSLPVSSVCSGCRSIDELEQNVETLKKLSELSASDRKVLEAMAEPYAGLNVENYKRVLNQG